MTQFSIEVALKKSKEAAAREFKVFQVYSDNIGVMRVVNSPFTKAVPM